MKEMQAPTGSGKKKLISPSREVALKEDLDHQRAIRTNSTSQENFGGDYLAEESDLNI